ncbi:MAG: gamma-glutamyltransferase, partial [Gammaproteobacteria bacterium]|nr:gamma-glutamyltransferase [Gammaproteobacteria bacterium]
MVMINTLRLLNEFDPSSVDEVGNVHLLIEAWRRAYRDRAVYLGDPDFVSIPADELLSPLYARGQATSIRLDRATPSHMLAGNAPATDRGDDTTHFSIIDQDGNRVAATMSINFWFGSGLIAEGTGVLLNNEMDDFSMKPGTPNGFGLIGDTANAIAPGKRMLSSMSPTFLETDRGVAILGTPGGSRIITMVTAAALAYTAGADAKEMVTLPRFHHQYVPDEVVYETDALSVDMIDALASLGHRLRAAKRPYGNMQVVTWDYATNIVEAASDPRGEGMSRVY